MHTKLRDSPGIRSTASRAREMPNGFSKPVCGILIALLLLLLFYVSGGLKNQVAEKHTSSQAVITRPSTQLRPSAAEFMPVITGGAGGSTSLGGNSSLGGGSHD